MYINLTAIKNLNKKNVEIVKITITIIIKW